jgi:glutamyl-tRNA synthetase
LAFQLLKEHKAYYCFCSKEELEKQREESLKNGTTPKYNRLCLHLTEQEIQKNLDAKIPAVIRLKMPDDTNIQWRDLIRGEMSVPTSALTDPVILKSNGIPMYNFAVVVDDYDMDITHVLRGEEHISNTPYQIAIKQALQFDTKHIEYGHLSIIVDDTGKKLSKRNLELKQFIEDYKKMGFVPEAIVNFLALLG